MLSALYTLKSKPFQEQIRTIELLTAQNLDLFERIRSWSEDHAEDRIFHTSISDHPRQVVRAALLAVVAADIASVPDHGAREPYRRQLDRLCNHFAINSADLTTMVRYASQIEDFLVGRTQTPEVGSK